MPDRLQSRTIIAVFAAALVAESITAADAQVLCATHAQIVDYLKGEFQELQGAYGLVGDKAILELFLSPHRATWTVVLTDVSGMSCILAAGDSWEQMPDIAELNT